MRRVVAVPDFPHPNCGLYFPVGHPGCIADRLPWSCSTVAEDHFGGCRSGRIAGMPRRLGER